MSKKRTPRRHWLEGLELEKCLGWRGTRENYRCRCRKTKDRRRSQRAAVIHTQGQSASILPEQFGGQGHGGSWIGENEEGTRKWAVPCAAERVNAAREKRVSQRIQRRT